jgi:hypothetical protein
MPPRNSCMRRSPMTTSFLEEARAYREKKAREVRRAAMRAAFFLSTGIEIDAALALEGDARAKLRQRLGRLIERERLRGAARHWSYDLNRHIALKQALDRLGDGGRQQATPKRNGGTGRRRRFVRAKPSGPVSASSCACDPGPSSWRAGNVPPRSSARPSDRLHRGPTSRGTDPG